MSEIVRRSLEDLDLSFPAPEPGLAGLVVE